MAYRDQTMITAFIDESGTHASSSLMVFTGSLFKQDKLARFEIDWMIHNLFANISHVHAVDIEPGNGEFRDRKRWPYHERLAFANRAQYINYHAQWCCLTVVLAREVYQDAYADQIAASKIPGTRRLQIDSAYGACFRAWLSVFSEFIAKFAPEEKGRVVVEGGHKNEGALRTIFDEFKVYAPENMVERIDGIDVGTKRESPGLQSADMSAYLHLRHETDQVPNVEDVDLTATQELAEGFAGAFRIVMTKEVLQGYRDARPQLGALIRSQKTRDEPCR